MVAGFDDPWCTEASLAKTRARIAEADAAGHRRVVGILKQRIQNYASLLDKEKTLSRAWKQAAIDQLSRAQTYREFIDTVHTKLRGEILQKYGEDGAKMIDDWLDDWMGWKADRFDKMMDELTLEYAKASPKTLLAKKHKKLADGR